MRKSLKFALIIASGFFLCGNLSANEKPDSNDIKSIISELPEDQQIDVIMSSGSFLELQNFDTGVKERIDRPDLLSADEILPYVAPIEQVREFYSFLISEGTSPLPAMVEANTIAFKLISEGSLNKE